MRRTFQDLARAAEVKDIVTRAISGTRRRRCSTTTRPSAADEKQAIAKVIQLAGARKALAGGPSTPRWYARWYAWPLADEKAARR